jgi:hypothetical protein
MKRASHSAGLQTYYCVAGFQIGSRTTADERQVWKPAIGSLAPARSALWALPSLRSGNPFRGFPSRSSQQTWKSALRFMARRIRGQTRRSPRDD